MARTYRRKKVKAEEDWGVHSYLESRGIHWYAEHEELLAAVPDAKHYVRYYTAMYHKDTRTNFGWNGNAPAGYRRSLNSVRRAKDKAETNRILRQGDYENYCFYPWYKDAGWYWW